MKEQEPSLYTRIYTVLAEVNNFKIENEKDLEAFRLTYISRSGKVSEILQEYNTLDKDLKIKLSSSTQLLKDLVDSKYKAEKHKLINNIVDDKEAEDSTIIKDSNTDINFFIALVGIIATFFSDM